MIIMDIPQTWTFVSYVRDSVSDYLPDNIDAELRESSVMVASELTENTIKFGCTPNSDSKKSASIHVDLTEDDVRITVNTTASLGNLDRVKHIIDTLKTTNDIEAIYLNRLQEIMETPSQSSSRLGLIRIVHEAKFSLDYDINGNQLKVIATRSLKPPTAEG